MRWLEVADEIFCIRYGPLDQTIGAIRTTAGTVVIDSRSHRVHAGELRNDLAHLDRRSPYALINTHFHWDHTFGNAQFTDATIIAHDRTRSALEADGEAMKAELATADWLTPEAAELIGEVEITPPTMTFSDRLSLHPGGHHIHMHHLGRGHTDSDIVIVVDDVVFAGDLVEVGAPPAFGDSFPAEWVATLDRLLELCSGPVIPGHGDATDRNFVAEQRDQIERAVHGEAVFPDTVMAQIASRMKAGSR